MITIYIGIDPGLDGALAVLDSNSNQVYFTDTPTLIVTGKGKSKRHCSPLEMAQSVRKLSAGNWTLKVALESVHAMPGQGVTSMFSMGVGFGMWQGVLAALQIPYELVTPQRWKKAMIDGQGKDKDASRQVAMRLFPQSAKELARKKDHGRADALLIAAYIRNRDNGIPFLSPETDQ